jgi:O-antigen/teichoic acid export membrane protein
VLNSKTTGIVRLLVSYGGVEAVAKGLNIILMLSLAALVDLHTYGAIAILVGLELVMMEFIVFGQHTALLRLYDSRPNMLARIYSSAVMLVLVASMIMLAVSAVLPLNELTFFSKIFSKQDLILLVLGVAFQCHILVYLSYTRMSNNFQEYGLIRIGYVLLKIVTVGGAVVLMGDVAAYPIGLFLGGGLFLLMVLSRINKNTGGSYFKLGELLKLNITLKNISIGFPLMVHCVIGVSYTFLDRFFIGRLMDEKNVGIYNFALIQGTAVFFVINVLALVFVPRIYRFAEYNIEAEKLLRKFLVVSLVSVVMLALPVYFLIFPMSLHFVSEDFSAGRDVVLFSLGTVLVHSFSVYGVYKLTALHQVAAVPLVTMIAFTCNVALNWYLIPLFGIEGAAAATLISEIVNGILIVSFANFMARRVVGVTNE